MAGIRVRVAFVLAAILWLNHGSCFLPYGCGGNVYGLGYAVSNTQCQIHSIKYAVSNSAVSNPDESYKNAKMRLVGKSWGIVNPGQFL